MNRRQFLATSGATTTFGVAGCVTAFSGASNRELAVRVADVFDAHHDETGLAFGIEAVSTALSADTLPSYDVTLSNTGEETYEISGWSTTMLETVSDPSGLKPISEGTAEAFVNDPPSQVHTDGCFTAEYVTVPAVDRSETLEPGDERTDRTYVIGEHDAFEDSCIEPGDYTMTQTYGVRKPRDDREPASKPSFEWGVTFTVSES